MGFPRRSLPGRQLRPEALTRVSQQRVLRAARLRCAALIGVAGLVLSACGGAETPSVSPSPTPSTTAPVEPSPTPVEPTTLGETPSESPTPKAPDPSETAEPQAPPFPDVVGGYELQGQSGSVGDYINVELEDDFFIGVTFSEVRDYDSGAGNNANERLDEQWFCHDTDSSPVMRWCATPLDGGGHVAFQGDTEAGVMVFAEEFLTLWQW